MHYIPPMTTEYKVELANKIGKIDGRTCAVGHLWGVGKYFDGCRNGYALNPQESEHKARETARVLNMWERDRRERA